MMKFLCTPVSQLTQYTSSFFLHCTCGEDGMLSDEVSFKN